MDEYVKQLEERIEELEKKLSHDEELQDLLDTTHELLMAQGALKTLLKHCTFFRFENKIITFHSEIPQGKFPLEYRVEIEKILDQIREETK